MRTMPVKTYTIEAPCKINLHLNIGEKRPDGFHDLESIFVTLAFGDTISFEVTPQKNEIKLSLECESLEKTILTEKNLVFKAVSLFRECTGYENGLNIRLFKRIPIGAGLGGGSSDAASTLLALNSIAGTALPMKKLVKMAKVLGSDVTFFLSGGAAFVCGRGELITRVKPPGNGKLWVVLVKPPFSSDTASAYRLLDYAKENLFKESAPQEGVSQKKIPKKALIEALKKDPQTWPYYNDFLPVFLAAKKEANFDKAGTYLKILENLRSTGSCFSGLSGSGSCCFGIYRTRESAENAEKKLFENGNFVKMTFFLANTADMVLQ